MKNGLPEQSRQWKGDSSALMVELLEHRKGPGAQTSDDVEEGVKGAYGGTWCIAEKSMFKGSGRWLSGPGRAFYGRYTFRSQMARDWNPAWWRLRTRASAQRC